MHEHDHEPAATSRCRKAIIPLIENPDDRESADGTMVSRRPVARKKNTGPIRFSLKTYAPEEIAKINARLGLDSERAFQPAEELLAEIAAVEEPTQEIPSAWFYHPDERAQLALLEREDLTLAWNPFGNANRRILVLWATAFAHAQHESVAWTPVLDHIAGRRGYWPLQSHAESVLNSPTFRQWLPFWLRQKLKYWAIEEQAAPLRNWIRDAEPERIRTLVRLRSDEFVGAALAHAHAIHPAELRRILERRPAIAPAIAKRFYDLPQELSSVLKDWAFEDLFRAEERLAAMPEDTAPHRRWEAAYGARTLEIIATKPRTRKSHLEDRDVERLVALLDAAGDPDAGPSRAAANILATYADRLREAELLELLPHFRDRPSELARLIDLAVHATPNVWRACLDLSQAEGVQHAIACNPKAIKVPEIRARLAESDSTDVLLPLLTNATGEEFARLFRKMARLEPDVAADVLRDWPDRARFLARTDLLPLMQSSDPSIRMLAITLLGDAAEADDPRPTRSRL